MKAWWMSPQNEDTIRFESDWGGAVFGIPLFAASVYFLINSAIEIILCPYDPCTRQEMVVWNILPVFLSLIFLYASVYLLSKHVLEIDQSQGIISGGSNFFGIKWKFYSHSFDEVIEVSKSTGTDEDPASSSWIVVQGKRSRKNVATWISEHDQEIADAIGVPLRR